MKWKSPLMPDGVVLEETTATNTYGKFTIRPLERGYGLTVGTALRRMLLSSIQGMAVNWVKLDGVLHEFSFIEGVKEDTTEIILNLKELILKSTSKDDNYTLYADKEGPGELKAGDISLPLGIEILNKEAHIATINENARLKLELGVTNGRGYVPAEQSKESKIIGVIPVDSFFSPVKKVAFKVRNTRIGQRTDYDQLVMEVWTDGSILPEDSLAHAAKLLKDHLLLFIKVEEEYEQEKKQEVDEEKERIQTQLRRSVDELELSVRSGNCLQAANIRALGDLVQKSESEMLKYRNFGRKSLSEIGNILDELNLSFGMDLREYFNEEELREFNTSL
ncbi:MAG: DNA-directed RNA polymerase subunit alpha [Candidatus Cloacimonetes bacterium 4572_55]|nr:MAG: DNA-directed RNA polymerase subunit alpha [Candidatus Cloacimonetes bacterium 4572_55]